MVFKILNSGDKIKKANIDALSNGEDKKFIYSISEKALRYDLTVPFARYVAQHQNNLIFLLEDIKYSPYGEQIDHNMAVFRNFTSVTQILLAINLYGKN